MPYWQVQELMVTIGGLLIVLIPVTGLTLRFAVRPFLADLRANRKARQPPEIADDQLMRIEQRLDDMEEWMKRIAEIADFDRQLRLGTPSQKPEELPKKL